MQLDIAAIAKKDSMIIASCLARRVVNGMHVATTGDLIEQLPDAIVDYFLATVDNAKPMDAFNEDILLSALICLATEGIDIDENNLEDPFNAFHTFMIMEGLFRKGLIEIKRQNWSIGNDATQLEVAKISDLGRSIVSKLTKDL
jgi:hypothetical protein